MAMSDTQITFAQAAAAVGTAAQQLRQLRSRLVAHDSTLGGPIDALAGSLDSLEETLGKVAWAPAPMPQPSVSAGGG